MKGRIERLRAEVKSDQAAVEARIEALEHLDLTGQPAAGDLAQAAVALHHAYCAVEAALSRIARTLGEGLPEGNDWHQTLLHVMGLEVENIRPQVLSAESVARLRRLLAFRHFFRHAYAVPLDVARLASLRSDALSVRPFLSADFDCLDIFLRELAAAAEP